MKENKLLRIIIIIFILAFVLLITRNLYISSQENKAVSKFNQEEYEQSITHYQAILKIKDEPQYYVNIAYNQYLLGNYQEAYQNLSQVIDQIDDREATYLLVLLYKQLGETEESLSLLEDMLSIDDSYSKAWQTLAAIELERESYDKVINAYQKIINLKPNAGETYLALANVYSLNDQIEKEISTYEEMLIRGATAYGKTREESIYIAEYNLGVSLYKVGRIEDARDVFTSATGKSMVSADAWYYLASCAALTENEGQMLYALQKAIEGNEEYLSTVIKDNDFREYLNTKRFEEFLGRYK